MLIAQALGEYGAMAALVDGIRSAGVFLEDFAREWGLTGLGIAIAAAVIWKMFTRVR